MKKNNQAQFDGFTTDDKVNEACEWLRKLEPEEGYKLGFSGGKDSIVTYWIAEQAGVKFHPYYSCTTIDPPEVMQFIKRNYPTVEIKVPRKSFWDMILERSIPPTRTLRWCCKELKEHKEGEIIVGVRAEESFKRAHRPRFEKIKKTHHSLYKPIFNFKEYDVWEVIDKYHLPYPSLYDHGFTRLGCCICPMTFGSRSKRLLRNMETYPHMWAKFKDTMRKWFALYREGDFEAWWGHYW